MSILIEQSISLVSAALTDASTFQVVDVTHQRRYMYSSYFFQTLYDVDLTTRRAMGSQLEDMMQECSWSGLVCTPLWVFEAAPRISYDNVIHVVCTSVEWFIVLIVTQHICYWISFRNFSAFTDRKYGNCYTFNSGAFSSTLQQTRAGQSYGRKLSTRSVLSVFKCHNCPDLYVYIHVHVCVQCCVTFSGLTMTLFIDAAEYIYSVTPSTGVRMLVHNQNQHPFMYDDGFNVQPGQRTAIKIEQVRSYVMWWIDWSVFMCDTDSFFFNDIKLNVRWHKTKWWIFYK